MLKKSVNRINSKASTITIGNKKHYIVMQKKSGMKNNRQKMEDNDDIRQKSNSCKEIVNAENNL